MSPNPRLHERRAWTRLSRMAVWLFAALWVSGCELGFPAGDEPWWELNLTNMMDQPKVKPQRKDPFGAEPVGMLLPPQGSVSTTDYLYPYKQEDADRAGRELTNPLTATDATLKTGEWVYTHYCIVCHGAKGAGDGEVTRFFPKPPHLMRPQARAYTDGRIFHVPMRGQASMPSHAKQLEPQELWAVVLYLRKLQAELPVAPPAPTDKPVGAVNDTPAPAVGEPPRPSEPPAPSPSQTQPVENPQPAVETEL